jgi:hypothetical protein
VEDGVSEASRVFFYSLLATRYSLSYSPASG